MIVRFLRTQWLFSLTLIAYASTFLITPERAAKAFASAATTFSSVLLLITAVFSLVGLLQVWISKEFIVSSLGREGGIKSLVIAVLCGTLLVGPAYIIFPLLMEIQKRGARWAVVTIVLTSYTIKLQMVPIEVEFLGWPFTLGRALITIALAIPTGLLIEAIMERKQKL
ncbi:Predicted permease [Desulfuromusa kysingii]|uniref:Predicted permease n=1 Tax=Desulfuromusa kysingii TaxID=37625 RepID=A0A1H4AVD5_9BACT|nr:permease [Desulfuromusa kysingii]SEA39833.1 Predicted permease [Desulfuromusa kysingii]